MHFGLKAGALALAMGLALGACSGGGDAPSDAPEEANGDATAVEAIDIDGIAYVPGSIEIDVGTEVTWTNVDDVLHTVTSGTQGEQGVPGVSEGTDPEPDGMFDGELPDAGAEFSFTFDEPGTYAYYCAIHVGMVGEVTVE